MMKQKMIALGLLVGSVLPIAGKVMPVHAVNTFTFNETEGRVKFIGNVKDNGNYVLRGVFGGRNSDTRDEFSFRVTKTGNYTFTFGPRGCSKDVKFGGMRILDQRRREITTASVCQVVNRRLNPGVYTFELVGQSRISPSTFLKYQAHIITPR